VIRTPFPDKNPTKPHAKTFDFFDFDPNFFDPPEPTEAKITSISSTNTPKEDLSPPNNKKTRDHQKVSRNRETKNPTETPRHPKDLLKCYNTRFVLSEAFTGVRETFKRVLEYRGRD